MQTADDEGHVRCDPDDLAGLGLLHDMEPDEVTRSRALLETFGVLDREPTGWLIKHYAPVGNEVPPAEVMAAIGRTLSRPVDAAPAPAPAPVVVQLESARPRQAQRWMAAPVGAAAAAAVVLVALVLSGQFRVPLVSRPASNSQQSAVGAATGPASNAPAGASNGNPQTVPPSGSPSAPSGSSTVPSGAQTPPGSTGAASTAALCPVGNVSATVDHVAQQLDSPTAASSIAVSLPPIVRTSASGQVRNNSADAVLVYPFPVTINFTDVAGRTHSAVTGTALAGPTPVAAGATIPWTVTVDDPRDQPVPGAANAGSPTWHWEDARLSASCPH